jgi:hypothetical protein
MPILRLATALAVTTLLAVAAVLAPSSASAEPAFYEVEYSVEVDITANWSISQKDMDDYPKGEFGGDIKARLQGTVDSVLFRNGRLLPEQPTGWTELTATGAGYTETTSWDPIDQEEDVTTGTCTADSAYSGSSTYVRRAASQPNATAERLTWRLAEAVPVGFVCGTNAFETAADLAYNGSAFPGGVFDTTFELPHEAIGMGKIIQHVSAGSSQRSPEHCPGKDAEYTVGCAFTWSGKLTFTKTDEWQYNGDDPKIPPPPPIDPRAEAIIHAVEQYGKEPVDPRADAVVKAVEQYQPAIDPRADAVSKAVEQYGQELRFKAVCQTGCTGTAEILPGGSRKPFSARAAAARKALAKLKFKVPAGKPREIRLKLPRKARAALKRARGASVKLTLKPKTGARKTLTLALKPRRR